MYIGKDWDTTLAADSEYEVTPPDYSSDNLLKEDGDPLLLETGDFMLLESATGVGASEHLKTLYAWIAPDSGEFSDGTPAYKIV